MKGTKIILRLERKLQNKTHEITQALINPTGFNRFHVQQLMLEREKINNQLKAAKNPIRQRRIKKTSEEPYTQLDPVLKQIENAYNESRGVPARKLLCPKCGEEDRHNTFNGLPWCFKCNCKLAQENKIIC